MITSLQALKWWFPVSKPFDLSTQKGLVGSPVLDLITGPIFPFSGCVHPHVGPQDTQLHHHDCRPWFPTGYCQIFFRMQISNSSPIFPVFIWFCQHCLSLPIAGRGSSCCTFVTLAIASHSHHQLEAQLFRGRGKQIPCFAQTKEEEKKIKRKRKRKEKENKKKGKRKKRKFSSVSSIFPLFLPLASLSPPILSTFSTFSLQFFLSWLFLSPRIF